MEPPHFIMPAFEVFLHRHCFILTPLSIRASGMCKISNCWVKQKQNQSRRYPTPFFFDLPISSNLLDHISDKDKCTPLHTAAFSGNAECLQVLIDQGATIDHLDIDQATPLHKAAFNGKLECLKKLIATGANLHASDKDQLTATHKVSLQENACFLLRYPFIRITSHNNDFFKKATYNDHHQILSFLLDSGSNLHCLDSKGATPLHIAAFSGSSKCCSILLAKKEIKKDFKDKEETTALHNAVYCGNTKLVQILCDAECSINEKTARYHSTPLHFGAYNGYLDCIKVNCFS